MNKFRIFSIAAIFAVVCNIAEAFFFGGSSSSSSGITQGQAGALGGLGLISLGILLLGKTGVGKSSFISSVNKVFNGSQTQIAYVEDMSDSVTKQVSKVVIKRQQKIIVNLDKNGKPTPHGKTKVEFVKDRLEQRNE